MTLKQTSLIVVNAILFVVFIITGWSFFLLSMVFINAFNDLGYLKENKIAYRCLYSVIFISLSIVSYMEYLDKKVALLLWGIIFLLPSIYIMLKMGKYIKN